MHCKVSNLRIDIRCFGVTRRLVSHHYLDVIGCEQGYVEEHKRSPFTLADVDLMRKNNFKRMDEKAKIDGYANSIDEIEKRLAKLQLTNPTTTSNRDAGFVDHAAVDAVMSKVF